MPTPHRTILVANPTARTGRAARSIERALALLEEAHLDPEFLATLPGGATVHAVASRLEEGDVARVVYLGGDGTFAEAAKGIILARERAGVDVPLGMLPMGTANDQGRSFGIAAGDRALPRNVEIIREGIEQWLDVGRIFAYDDEGTCTQQDLWFDNCGIGLSAQILYARNRDRDRVGKIPLVRRLYRDKLVYTTAALRSLLGGFLLGGKRFQVELEVDGSSHFYDGVTDLVILDTILYAGDWIFAPECRPDDGKLEIVVVRGHADWAAAALANHKRNPVTGDDLAVLGLAPRQILQGADIRIALHRPANLDVIPAQIDGEEWTSADHYRVETLFHHLRLIVPEDPHWI